MTGRYKDEIRIEADGVVFDAFEEVEVTHDLMKPAEAKIVFGDDGSDKLADLLAPGTTWRVFVNRSIHITGRAEINEADSSGDNGTRFSITIRTKLSDAMVASADPKTKVNETTIADFIEALFEPLGYSALDFNFAGAAKARQLITGATREETVQRKDLESIQAQQAKAQIGESIYECARRHLERHGLMLWDHPDGRIVVGAPDDGQAPIYRFRSKRDRSQWPTNNLIAYRKVRDWSGVPSKVSVFGATITKGDIVYPLLTVKGETRSIKGVAINDPVDAVAQETEHFKRAVSIQATGLRTSEQAQAKANRELSRLRMRQDAWELVVDGWGYLENGAIYTFGVNTVANIDTDVLGVAPGDYLVVRVTMRWRDTEGFISALACVAKGILKTI
jgi:prophage tail gpP-like protein